MGRLRIALRAVVAAPRRWWMALRTGGARRLLLTGAGVAVGTLFLVSVYQSWTLWHRFQNMTAGEPIAWAPAAPDFSAEGMDTGGPEPDVTSDGPSPFQDGEAAAVAASRPEPPGPAEEEAPRRLLLDELIPPVPAAEVVPPGWRRDRETAFWRYEPAVVLRAAADAPVVAAGPGVVAAVSPSRGGGWDVSLEHDGGVVTVYGNVYYPTVAPGDGVSGHARLGSVGAPSPRDAPSAAPSVSFVAYRDGEPVDVALLLTK